MPSRAARRASNATGMSDPGAFLVTTEFRRFAEFCDACRRHRYIGLCYGPPGVGKTLSARHYARWDLLSPLLKRVFAATARPPDLRECHTIVYTPTVANNPNQIVREVASLQSG